MHGKWWNRAGWAFLAVFIVAGFTVPFAVSRGWFTSGNSHKTHRELADHLAAKGVPVSVVPRPEMNRPGITVADFEEPLGFGKATVYLCDDQKTAREYAGAAESGFVTGRFAITQDTRFPQHSAALLEKIRGALK